MSHLLVGFFSGWAVFAVVLALHLVLPARRVEGYARDEHSGALLRYRLNGLRVFALCVALWFVLGYTGVLPWDWLWRHRWAGAGGACVLGLAVAAWVVLSAPSRGGSLLAEYYLGRRKNPQMFNGRADAKMYLYVAGATLGSSRAPRVAPFKHTSEDILSSSRAGSPRSQAGGSGLGEVPACSVHRPEFAGSDVEPGAVEREPLAVLKDGNAREGPQVGDRIADRSEFERGGSGVIGAVGFIGRYQDGDIAHHKDLSRLGAEYGLRRCSGIAAGNDHDLGRLPALGQRKEIGALPVKPVVLERTIAVQKRSGKLDIIGKKRFCSIPPFNTKRSRYCARIERRRPSLPHLTQSTLQFVIHNALRMGVHPMSILSIRLTERLDARLSEESRLAKQPKSLIARVALERFLADRRRDRFLARMTRAAAAIEAKDAITLAEEALPLDNESLGLTKSGDWTPK